MVAIKKIMDNLSFKQHWEKIYETKNHQEVGWYQQKPMVSLSFFEELNFPLDANIIDIGGGESYLVDNLAQMGYKHISVLDIATKAIEKAKARFKESGQNIHWIVSDVLEFSVSNKYNVWHDRAAFHFLLEEKDIQKYIEHANNALKENGLLFVGTFSENGPGKCSGLLVRKYAIDELKQVFSPYFEPIKCFNIDHFTPSDNVQNYTFCTFRKKH